MVGFLYGCCWAARRYRWQVVCEACSHMEPVLARKHLHNILKCFCFRAFCVYIVLNHMQQSTKWACPNLVCVCVCVCVCLARAICKVLTLWKVVFDVCALCFIFYLPMDWFCSFGLAKRFTDIWDKFETCLQAEGPHSEHLFPAPSSKLCQI